MKDEERGEIIANLANVSAQIEKIDPEKLRGVAFIAMPNGKMIETVVSGSELSDQAFLKQVVDMLSEQLVSLQGQPGSWPPRR